MPSEKETTPAEPDFSKKSATEYGLRQKLGLPAGAIVFFIILLMPTPDEMSLEAKRVLALSCLMAIWWICESIPIPATSLLPIVLFPLLGVMSSSDATLPYANHVIYLFMGGFIIALAMQRWNLHRRIALHVIDIVGFSPMRLVLGFMLASALLSAFVSNTATTVMMLPIGIAVIMQISSELQARTQDCDEKSFNAFALNLMLGIAYASSIGGIATLIGTPPNIVMAGYLEKTFGYEITFLKWMIVGVPLALLFLPLSWLWLTKIANPMKNLVIPDAANVIKHEIKEMGQITKPEILTLIVFGMTSLCWVFRHFVASFFPNPDMIKDSTIAIAGAVALFLIPVNLKKKEFVMNWEWATKLPWGVLVLFGGGLSLAKGFEQSGLAAWFVEKVTIFDGMPILVILIGITVLVIFLTEFTSNTATTTMLMPVLAGVAIGLNQSPFILLAPAAIAASCAFMLPVATPPNAIVFGSGYVKIPDMARSGFGLNLIGILLIPTFVYLILIPVFGIVIGEVPDWAK